MSSPKTNSTQLLNDADTLGKRCTTVANDERDKDLDFREPTSQELATPVHLSQRELAVERRNKIVDYRLELLACRFQKKFALLEICEYGLTEKSKYMLMSVNNQIIWYEKQLTALGFSEGAGVASPKMPTNTAVSTRLLLGKRGP